MIVGALLQDKDTSHRRRGNYEFYNPPQQDKQKVVDSPKIYNKQKASGIFRNLRL